MRLRRFDCVMLSSLPAQSGHYNLTMETRFANHQAGLDVCSARRRSSQCHSGLHQLNKSGRGMPRKWNRWMQIMYIAYAALGRVLLHTFILLT